MTWWDTIGFPNRPYGELIQEKIYGIKIGILFAVIAASTAIANGAISFPNLTVDTIKVNI